MLAGSLPVHSAIALLCALMYSGHGKLPTVITTVCHACVHVQLGVTGLRDDVQGLAV